MKILAPAAIIAALSIPGFAHADSDCHSPMSEWHPRETVTAFMTGLGITTDRLKVDDGCYEIRGRDVDGNWVELEIEPATLAVQKLEVSFQPNADISRYLPRLQRVNPEPALNDQNSQENKSATGSH